MVLIGSICPISCCLCVGRVDINCGIFWEVRRLVVFGVGICNGKEHFEQSNMCCLMMTSTVVSMVVGNFG